MTFSEVIIICNDCHQSLHSIAKSYSVYTKVKVLDRTQFKYPCRTYAKDAFMVLSDYK
ncbi:MAG: hypothetical protein ACI9VO_002172 [Colwellia sp.]|jgi:hypothetical protein